ncbi:MAG: hypothetical protein LBP53_00295 [Candidatus Peribacteria bacterium]|nr:hypothetical protein [Candidatus Peribacteria bacterium]
MEVTISSGKLPYSATVSPSGIVITTVEGSELTITGVKAGSATVVVKGVDGGSVSLPVVVTAPPDPLATFKDNPTPRWEFVRGETVSSTDPLYTFIIDKGTLFSSSQNKWGYASNDGNTFRLIEWGTSPILRTESGTVTVSSFRIVKEEQRTIWITFFANDTEYRVVVEKIQI